jgi:hypothetical protein
VLLVDGLGIGYLTWWLPVEARRQRAMNERSAYTALKTLSSANADFRANDRDWNRVLDFWTGDIAGLYSTLSSGQPIALLPRALAEADASPLTPLVPRPIPYHGYYFTALSADGQESPPEPYRQDTDGKSGKVHHLRKFGYCAYPAEPGITGKYVYIINENNTVLRRDNLTPPPKNWPSDSELQSGWGKVQ